MLKQVFGVGVGGVFRERYEDLEGRMERLACEKTDTEGSGEQEDRQTGEKIFFFLSVHNNSTHMREISRLKR